MAYVDALLQFSSAQTVTGSSAVMSTNVVDLTTARDLGEGFGLDVVFRPGSAFAGLVSMECQVIQADDAGLSTNVDILGGTGQIPVAQLVPSKAFVVTISPRLDAGIARRYIGVRYVPVGNGTAGTISAQVDLTPADGTKSVQYASGSAGFKVL